MHVLVTGATGYIGGRLIPRLLEAGHRVTALVREASRYTGRSESPSFDLIEAELLDGEAVTAALAGRRFDAAYYLVHSMMGGRHFAERDKQAAQHFAAAIPDCPHVIYLGGLMPDIPAGDASPHLASRAQTGQTLRDALPGRVTEFRAGPIIGSGSASFEMVRYLTERLPVMLTPRWVRNTVTPIAIRDVLAYLLGALGTGPVGIVDIGAAPLTFAEMMQQYARCRGLVRRTIITTPVLAPKLAARWVGLVTPITNRLAVPLVEGVAHPLLADTARARSLFPHIQPIDYEQAVQRAAQRTVSGQIETRWTGALGQANRFALTDREGLIRESRRIEVNAAPQQVFDTFTALGGDTGWLVWTWAWKMRGWLDQLVGGPGLRRGRRSATELLVGETLDFWRVERVDPPRQLLLRAEMKLPGKAWLQFDAQPAEHNPDRTLLTQIAWFEPKGLPGLAYWYAIYPLHLLIFRDLVHALARRAERDAMQ